MAESHLGLMHRGTIRALGGKLHKKPNIKLRSLLLSVPLSRQACGLGLEKRWAPGRGLRRYLGMGGRQGWDCLWLGKRGSRERALVVPGWGRETGWQGPGCILLWVTRGSASLGCLTGFWRRSVSRLGGMRGEGQWGSIPRQRWMGCLGPSAALHCRARLGAYRWEGRRQLLGEDLKLLGGLAVLPGFPSALN